MESLSQIAARLQQHQQILLRLFAKLQSCLDGVEYFAIGGTLLGIVRGGALIPHDDDVDLGFVWHEFRKVFDVHRRVKFEEHGLELYWDFVWKVSFVGDRAVFIDLFPFVRVFDRYIMELPYLLGWPRSYILADELFPLAMYPFSGLLVPAAHNPEPHLARDYGDDWRTPKSNHLHVRAVTASAK